MGHTMLASNKKKYLTDIYIYLTKSTMVKKDIDIDIGLAGTNRKVRGALSVLAVENLRQTLLSNGYGYGS